MAQELSENSQGECLGRCGPRALWGWAPPDLTADRPIERLADRIMPRAGIGACLYLAAIILLLIAAPRFPSPIELSLDGVAALAGMAWCSVNFWRCRQAHCLVTSIGWTGLAVFDFVEAGIGRSFIGGDEQLLFLAVLAASLVFEAVWTATHRTNAMIPTPIRT